ncbi:hypothetical protein EBR96_03505, partial [bacterium]|nr:hypothetical protein [bacterium]
MSIFRDADADLAILALIAAVIAGIYEYYRLPTASGDSNLKHLANYIGMGIRSYFRSQLLLSGIVLLLLAAGPLIFGLTHPKFLVLSLLFLAGGFTTMLISWVSIRLSTRGAIALVHQCHEPETVRTTTLMRAGTSVGIVFAALALLFSTITAFLFKHPFHSFQFAGQHTIQHAETVVHHATIAKNGSDLMIILAFVMGALLQTLMMRISGGLFHQISDMASRSVGSLEFDIGDDSFKNPASISRYISIHVGKAATTAANGFETFMTALSMTVIVFVAVAALYPDSPAHQSILVLLHIVSIGSTASIISLILTRFFSGRIRSMSLLFVVSYGLTGLLSIGVAYGMLYLDGVTSPGEMTSMVIGTLLGIGATAISYLFTHSRSPIVKDTVKSSEIGVLPIFISGFSKALVAATIVGIAVVFAALLA